MRNYEIMFILSTQLTDEEKNNENAHLNEEENYEEDKEDEIDFVLPPFFEE